MLKEALLARTVRLALGGATAGLALLTIPAQAQEPQRLERVEITGSSIKRIDAESALPVQILRRADIEQTGATTTVELLQKLPAAQRSTAEAISVGGGGSGFAGISLHGLGETRTLVLLNGRRIATFGGQTLIGKQAGVDLKTIPLAAIERVEILTDGASALYGADAIGGVVNIILRRNFSAGEVTGGFASPTAPGGDERSFSVVKGFGDLNADGYNFMLGFSHDQRKPIAAGSRSFAESAIVNFSHNGAPYRFSRGSPFAIPANVLAPGPTSPFLADNGFCPPDHTAIGGFCAFNYLSMLEIQPASEHNSLIASLSKKITPDLRLFADAMLSKSSTLSRVAPTLGQVLIPTTSPLFPYLNATLGVVTDTVAFWRIADVGQRVTSDQTNASHLVVGLEGTALGWDYTTSLTRSVSEYKQYLRDGWVATGAITAALGSGLLNPFVGPGQQTLAGQAVLDGAKRFGYFDGGKATLDLAELRGSREVARLNAGPVMLGAGLTYQKEHYQTNPSALAQGIGETRFGDTSALVPYASSRNSWAGFAELVAPLTKQLEASASLRHDQYSDFGGSTNYKLGARWQPSRALLFRASTGTGFRAPTVPQIAAGRMPNGVTGGSYACPFAPGDLPAGVECPGGVTQYNVFQEGNPNLEPETSRQWSLGMRWEPSDAVSLGMDLWSVDLKQAIGQVGEAIVFGDPQTYRSAFTSYFDIATGKTLLALNQGNVNLGDAVYRGIDFDARTRIRTPLGLLSTNLLATWMFEHSYQRLTNGPFFSDLGRANDAVMFRWQGRLVNTLTQGSFSHALTMNFKSGYDETANVTNLTTLGAETITRRVKPYVTWDWQTRWKASSAIDIAAGVLNLLDQDPPLSLKNGPQQTGYDERYTDVRGRTLYIKARYRF